MMTLDYGGDEGAMLYAQVGQHHLARATETSPKRSSGLLSCLSARPADLADAARTRPRVVSVFLSTVPFVYSKRAAAARSPEVALSTIERFVAVTSLLAVELPTPPSPLPYINSHKSKFGLEPR